MFGNLFSIMDWAVIFILILVFFGPEKLPHIAKTIAKTIQEIKKAANGLTEDLKNSINVDEAPRKRRSLPPPSTEDIAPTQTAPYSEEAHPDSYSEYASSATPEGNPVATAPHAEPAHPEETPAAAHDEHPDPTAH